MSNLINIIGSGTVEGLAPNQATFTISLTEVLPEDLTLKYSTVDGTAINGTTKDYTRVSNGSITFAAGETVKNITIDVSDNDIIEPDEFFFVQVFIPRLTPPYNPSSTDLLAATGIGTITDTLTATTNTILEDPLENIENLRLEGSSNINGTGNELDNVLTGNNGNNVLEGLLGRDTLEGKGGTDTLKGGLGDDFYIIRDNLDVIEEEVGSGFDTVYANVFYKLGENLESLVVDGNIFNVQGNDFNNLLVGNNVNNRLYGYLGNDTLQGNNGTDSLYGGSGDDTYIIDPLDVIYEYQDTTGGFDTIQAGFTYDLGSAAHVENLNLIGTGNFKAVGNDQNNEIVGNSGDNILKGLNGEDSLSGSTGNDLLMGNEQNDVLEGGSGQDTLVGGPGDDVYLLSNPEDINDRIWEHSGNDRVEAIFSYTLGSHLENLKLTGDGDINATGNSKANVLTGNSGDNILDGLAGTDIMIGGSGDDTYIVENITDQVIEEGGTSDRDDTIISYVDYTLEDVNNVENLSLVGNALSGIGNSSNNKIIGNQLDNSLSGNDGNDSLDGGLGNDTLNGNDGRDTIDGGLGNDTLNGGAGADIYLVDSSSDIVIETLKSISSSERDLIQSSASYTLPENVENLDLLGTDNLEGIGNELNNSINGNSGKNNLVGNDGDDTIKGNDGDDTLVGNEGDDSLDGGLGVDSLDGGLGDDIYVVDNIGDVVITGGVLDGIDTVRSTINYTLGSHLENLTLTGSNDVSGTGNELDNIILGNSGDNGISGGLGDDTLDGGTGNDFVSGGLGDDDLDGGTGNDFVSGGSGDDTLDGDRGIDTLVGGVGNEQYYVDEPEDIIIESREEGSDHVFSSASTYTLSDNLENLTLTGSKDSAGIGNDLNNNITGNSRSNLIDGGEGLDTLEGGRGSDSYIVDRSQDVIIEEENLVTEVDTAFASVYYVLDANVENLVLTGTTITGKGNAGDNFLVGNVGNNWLVGFEGNDTLDGGAGKDTLLGGTDDDTYVIDNVDDDIRENSGEGLLDTAQSLVNYTLAANVENLVLLGTNNLTGTGNVENNLINGNSGDNVLSGKSGDDTLLGGAGNDILSGDNANDLLEGGTGADRFTYDSGRVFSGTDFGTDNIKDFTRSDGDKIALGKTTFELDSDVGGGFSKNTEFASVATDSAAVNSSAIIVYSSETGNIFYNKNGTTIGGESLLTTLGNIPDELDASDFVII
ncbi:MAG: Calx-beta domain-containing protein [Xenococcus sp. MO_188.B8]|nr:Calx-beta domain-containing protein [Xenococcus sp. MO_188.B8]